MRWDRAPLPHVHICRASPAPHPSQKTPAESNPTQSPSWLLPPSTAAKKKKRKKINEIFSHQNEEEQWMRSASQGLPN